MTKVRLFLLLCVAVFALGIACAWCAPPIHAASSYFTARWDTATSATVQWTQASRACLSKWPRTGPGVFIGCYDRLNATITLTFGGAETDGAYRPMSGDRYCLDMGGTVMCAPLVGRAQYVAVVRR